MAAEGCRVTMCARTEPRLREAATDVGRTPESFVADHPDAVTKPPLPPGMPDGFHRQWRLEALHDARDARRVERGLTWAEVARAIGVGPGVLAGYANTDTFVGFPAVMRVTRWLERPLTDFIRASSIR